MPVDTPHPEYNDRVSDWELIGHCMAGERKIKEERTKYLPMPNAADKSPENVARYDAYLQRAVFHNVTGRTVENNVGQVMSVAPEVKVPESMQPWLENLSGDGITAEQSAKAALGHICSLSRAGLFTDYPVTTGANLSIADVEKNGIRPKVIAYHPAEVINWKLATVGALVKLSLVVIRESAPKPIDEFTDEPETQYRALRLKDNVYTVEVWVKTGATWAVDPTKSGTPTKSGGATFDVIPFTFIGARKNSATVEKPLMLDIATLNLAHYRNSADYEEGVYMLGQPTPWAAGLSDDWVETHLKGGKFYIGSRTLIPLPEGGAAGLLQANENGMAKEAIDMKEAQMTALGAEVVDQAEIAKTATETAVRAAADTAILAACANNVSAAYTQALVWAAEFAGVAVKKDEIVFKLNTDFAISRMSSEEQSSLISLHQGKLLTWTEARSQLRESGLATLDDEAAKEELEAQESLEMENAMKEVQGQTDQAIRLKQETETPPAEK